MTSILKFIGGVIPALAGACLSILGISEIVNGLAHRAAALSEPNYVQSGLVLIWLFCAMAGSIACPIAWLKELRKNTETNKWLVGGIGIWILSCLALVVIATIEFRTATFMRFEDFCVVAICCSSVVFGAFLLHREIKLFRNEK